MTAIGPKCLVCSCENTMQIDASKLSKALGRDVGIVFSHLCRSQIGSFEKSLGALSEDGDLLVACTQEAPLFQEIAEENGHGDRVNFVNIRENAGWSDDGRNATAKMAALIAVGNYRAKPARLKTVNSDGMCLVYGSGQPALELAQLLSRTLSVTLLLSSDDDLMLPRVCDVPVYRGDIVEASGSFGNFKLTVNNYAALLPSSRKGPDYAMTRDGAKTGCSVILDLSGKAALFSGHAHRDGYKKVDPGSPADGLRAVLELADMSGEFEKPIYVDYKAETCAHSRSQKQGCSKCLDACPAGAISSLGGKIAIDTGICGGCGSCHAVCPTGSISYQYPQRSDVISRMQALLAAYSGAKGKSPVLLLHDEPHGADLIAAMARYGRGLPAHVLPQTLHAVTSIGHVEMAALIASGAEQIVLLCDPAKSDELAALETECGLANAILKGLGLGDDPRCVVVAEADPDKVEEALWKKRSFPSRPSNSFQPAGSKRDVARLAFSALREQSKSKPEMIPLPQGAPYGRVEIDQAACTLCMACTSACPASAIMDTPGEPRLRFVESACVQCGLCVSTCPESALSLQPRLNFTEAAMQPVTLYEEEPFCCIVCDTPFATKSTIERISKQLAGKHSMFASGERANLIQMCQDCRVEAQANSSQDPFAAGTRPRVRTTEDYLAVESGKLSADDFLIDD